MSKACLDEVLKQVLALLGKEMVHRHVAHSQGQDGRLRHDAGGLGRAWADGVQHILDNAATAGAR